MVFISIQQHLVISFRNLFLLILQTCLFRFFFSCLSLWRIFCWFSTSQLNFLCSDSDCRAILDLNLTWLNKGFPIRFLRILFNVLGNKQGTIFRWHHFQIDPGAFHFEADHITFSVEAGAGDSVLCSFSLCDPILCLYFLLEQLVCVGLSAVCSMRGVAAWFIRWKTTSYVIGE